jgi:hypothetical protein
MGRSEEVGHDNPLNVLDCGRPPGPTILILCSFAFNGLGSIEALHSGNILERPDA